LQLLPVLTTGQAEDVTGMLAISLAGGAGEVAPWENGEVLAIFVTAQFPAGGAGRNDFATAFPHALQPVKIQFRETRHGRQDRRECSIHERRKNGTNTAIRKHYFVIRDGGFAKGQGRVVTSKVAGGREANRGSANPGSIAPSSAVTLLDR
jgi:hypothetical protein